MLDNNTQGMTQTNVGRQLPSFKSQLRDITVSRQAVKQSAEDNSLWHFASNTKKFYWDAYDTTDERLQKANKKAAQMSAVAYMMKMAANRNWQDWSDAQTEKEVFTRYFWLFPEDAWAVKEYINSEWDPEEFWMEMWWVPTDEEESFMDALWNVLEQLAAPYNIAWKWIRNLWYSIQDWYIGKDEWRTYRNALTEYVHDNYTFPTDEDREWSRLRTNAYPEALSEYTKWQNPTDAWIKTLEWWALALWETVTVPWAIIAWTLAVGSEIPYIQDAIAWWMWAIVWLWWITLWILSHFLPDEYLEELDWLITEETKELTEWFIWWYYVAKWWKQGKSLYKWTQNKYYQAKQLVNDAYKDIKSNPLKLFTKLKDYLTDSKVAEKWKNWYNESTLKREVIDPAKERYAPDWDKEFPEEDLIPEGDIKWRSDANLQMEDISTMISKWAKPNQRVAVNETLKTLPKNLKSTTKNLSELSNNIEKTIMDEIVKAEDTFLGKDVRKFTPEEIKKIQEWNVTLEWTKSDYSVDYWNDPVETAFNMIREMEWWPRDKVLTKDQAIVEAKYKKYVNEWLTRLEIADLARELTKRFKIYKTKWMWMYDTQTAIDVEPIRVALKSITRDWYKYAWVNDALVELDRIYSNAATTVELLADVIDQAAKQRWNRYPQTPTQRKASKTIKYSKNMWKAFRELLLWDKELNASEVNDNLNYLLKIHDSWFDALWREWNNFDKLVSAANKMAKELEIFESFPDGEVMPDTKIWEWTAKAPKSDWFEDVVDIIDSEELVKMKKDLNKAKKEELMWNYTKAVWEFLKELWLDDAATEELTKNIQEPLFIIEEWQWGKRVDMLWRNKWKTKSKSKSSK